MLSDPFHMPKSKTKSVSTPADGVERKMDGAGVPVLR